MYQGTVISIGIAEGKGYIRESDGGSIMFLLNSVYETLTTDDKVSYEVEKTPEWMAINVRKI